MLPRSLARIVVGVTLACWVTAAGAQTPDLQGVARNLVQSVKVTTGDKVLVTGSVRDAPLLEHIAVETMKAGGQPLLTFWSEELARRSYDEVPTSWDTMERTLDLGLVNMIDAQISIDIGDSEAPLAGVPQARLIARAKSFEPANAAFLKRSVRFVNLGNGLYPTATLAGRLGLEQKALAAAFWKAAAVPADMLRAKAQPLRAAIAKAKTLTVTHPGGTNLSFTVDADRGFISDGAITPEKVKQGGAAAQTWLPAGELIIPATAGTADGKLVFDKVLWRGKEVRGLTLSFTKGRLTSMTAASNIEGLKESYEAASGAKDQFGFVNIGLNPETKLPLGTGWIVWTASGSVTLGFGDNRGAGGTNVSEFGFAAQLGGATLKADGTVLIENGGIK